ncbi:6-phosphogluconolactonase [Phenylobacterium sp.]|uniref:6-phosphogluconolactonase n=1 Tax=Phenylobacterium sp. TaxID=1871053 RepID=UPI0025D57766|nr:6-phosphogluconolactonase [Phenylobacterium sp.]
MIESYADNGALADAAAQAIARDLSQALGRRGAASLVATGGRSPGPVYDRLRAAPLDWSKVSVTLSDDRCVDAGTPDSNLRLVRERLLQGPAVAARFLPLWPADAREAAAIESLFPFDAVMLGMGEDGHIASLIPGDPGLEDGLTTADLLREVPAGLGAPPIARITLTLAALLNARAIFLLIAGGAKREVIRRAWGGEDLPVGRLLSQSKAPVRIFWQPGV